MTLLFVLFTTNLLATTNTIELDYTCVIEGHGGGCGIERIPLKAVKDAVSYKATISETYGCYEDEYDDFCNSRVVAQYESAKLMTLPLVVDAREDGLYLNVGHSKIYVNFYDNSGSYLTSQIINVIANISSEMEM